MSPDLLDDGELPRERVWQRGASIASDDELLAILLGTGTRDRSVMQLAHEVRSASGGLGPLSRASPRELAQVLGIGLARATRIVAAFELGRRSTELEAHRETIRDPADVHRLLASRLVGLQQEVFFAIGVDVRNGMMDIVEVARGTVCGVEVHPREVFRPLIRMAAAAGVVAHNHPTGDPTPSNEDLALTLRLRDVGDLVGIPIVDHVVIGGGRYRSVVEQLESTIS